MNLNYRNPARPTQPSQVRSQPNHPAGYRCEYAQSPRREPGNAKLGGDRCPFGHVRLVAFVQLCPCGRVPCPVSVRVMCPVVLCCVRLFPVVSNRVRLSTVSSKIEMTTVKNEILDIRSIVFGVRCPDTFFLLSVSFWRTKFWAFK